MSRLLRIALAPLAELQPDSLLHYAWLNQDGSVAQTAQATLQQLAEQLNNSPVEAILHPSDSLLAELPFPPLPEARLSAAVQCAVEPLMLDSSAEQHIIHSQRSDAGLASMAWLEQQALDNLFQLLARHSIKIRALYAAPFFLPTNEHSWSACLVDGYLVVRKDREAGWVHPLPEAGQLQLQAATAEGIGLNWVGDAPDQTSLVIDQLLPDAERWAGPRPSWGWKAKRSASRDTRLQWTKPLVCCALAVLVWVTGLNLYANQLAEQGRQLQTTMGERVKQAFPEIPVILNPVQQARQQSAARLAGTADSTADMGFSQLVQQAASAMPFMVGGVDELTFTDTSLQLTLLADAGQPPADLDWQTALTEAGLQAEATASGWHLQPQGDPSVASKPQADSND
ncbi:MAG: type II secretion system protein GspL [Rhodobacteraceae bacterium]|nr:type II secretion system protein GspL [Paracoccaceae bacterium]